MVSHINKTKDEDYNSKWLFLGPSEIAVYSFKQYIFVSLITVTYFYDEIEFCLFFASQL